MLFFGHSLIVAAQLSVKTGVVYDSVPIPGTDKETYALYLPKSFEASQLSPIVLIFEPAARGRIGVEAFIEVSETYGYILVCSNDSKNGPYNRNFDIANRLFTHIFSRFNVYENQIYVAGFSGGSRLATAIACLAENITGVIACGAGFSHLPAHKPTAQNFSYVGLCGNRDMNYSEMVGVNTYLQKLNFNHTMITYDGDHSWPPKEQLLTAFHWLETQGHLKGNKTLPEAELYKSFSYHYNLAADAEKNGRLLEAMEHYVRIVKTYGSLYNIDSIQKNVLELHKRKKYNSNLKALSTAFEKELILSKKLIERFEKDLKNPAKAKLSWWDKELQKLDKYTSTGSEMKKMVARVKNKVFASAYSRNNPMLYRSNDDQRKFCSAICKLIYPAFGN